MMKDLQLKYTAYSDPTHKLRNYLQGEGLIDVRVTVSNVHPKIRQYPNGVVQPGVLCVGPERKVLFAWAIDPSVMNLGGASDRPVPRNIWTVVQAKLADPNSEDVPIRQLPTRGCCSVCSIL